MHQSKNLRRSLERKRLLEPPSFFSRGYTIYNALKMGAMLGVLCWLAATRADEITSAYSTSSRCSDCLRAATTSSGDDAAAYEFGICQSKFISSKEPDSALTSSFTSASKDRLLLSSNLFVDARRSTVGDLRAIGFALLGLLIVAIVILAIIAYRHGSQYTLLDQRRVLSANLFASVLGSMLSMWYTNIIYSLYLKDSCYVSVATPAMVIANECLLLALFMIGLAWCCTTNSKIAWSSLLVVTGFVGLHLYLCAKYASVSHVVIPAILVPLSIICVLDLPLLYYVCVSRYPPPKPPDQEQWDDDSETAPMSAASGASSHGDGSGTSADDDHDHGAERQPLKRGYPPQDDDG